MITFEEYKQAFADAYGVEDEETLRLAYIIDGRMEEAKGILGSANKGTGYWIAERLVQKGYHTAGEGTVVIHKDGKNRTEDEIEWLVKHNAEVRKETAKEIYKDVLYLRELMVNNDDSLCILRNVESWAKEEGV